MLKLTYTGGKNLEYYIYLTTNLINGKKYIGQHKGKPNDKYFGSGTTILKALKKYGKENFQKEILCYCNTREEADEQEKYYIAKFNAVEDENFYNNSEGGTGGDGFKAVKKWVQNNPEKAKELYKKSGIRLNEWRVTHQKEYQEKCVKPFLEASHQYWKNNPEKMKKHMDKVNEAKEKWQKEHPEEHKKQVDKWRKAGSDANSQMVICITTGEIFQSQSEAGRYYNVPQSNISKCLRGERHSAGKHPVTGEKLFWDFYNKPIDK